MKGKVPLKGEKIIMWDSLEVDITKLREYLNFRDDTNHVENTALQRCKVINETL